jgi:hypothetical protein
MTPGAPLVRLCPEGCLGTGHHGKRILRAGSGQEFALQWRMTVTRPEKITFRQMREMGVRGLLIYCSDYRCSHHTTISGDRWPDDVRLSDIEPCLTCQASGQRGADVRPNFDGEKEARLAAMST